MKAARLLLQNIPILGQPRDVPEQFSYVIWAISCHTQWVQDGLGLASDQARACYAQQHAGPYPSI